MPTVCLNMSACLLDSFTNATMNSVYRIKGSFYVNGDLKVNANFKRRISNNTILVYQRNGLHESLAIDGPTNIEIIVLVLYQSDVPLINYSYKIARHSVDSVNSTDFHWDYTDTWTPCSKSCGAGAVHRIVAKFTKSILNETLLVARLPAQDYWMLQEKPGSCIECNVFEYQDTWRHQRNMQCGIVWG